MKFKTGRSPFVSKVLQNENGVVVVAALVFLVLLTVISITSNNVSNTEIQIAGNELVYQQNFYRAEGATLEAVELLEAMADPKIAAPAWLEPALNSVTAAEIETWQFGGAPAPRTGTLADTSFVVISEGISKGSSLDMGSSKVHSYAVYGRCEPADRGATNIQIGYRKAF
jgi:hypothetical protein